MKNIALIGSTGSIGQEIYNQLSQKDKVHVDTFNRKNIEGLLNSEYDVVICAAPSSGKLKTNLGLDNRDKDIEKLCKVIKEVKTERFILISSQSAINEEDKPYGKVQKRVMDSVLSHHKNYTVYMVDTLYGPSLNKGFISDIITKRWSFLSDELIQKLPELTNYYRKIENTNLWEGYIDLPKDILEKLPNIVDIYPDDKIFQTTPISTLARTVVENIEVSQGLKNSISETEVFSGKQIKDLYENPNENTFLGKYFMKQKI
ncbi:hypothetical protein ACWOCB_04850 [Gemella haemolysans]|uniref:NAD dependent epimerase/dehydratase family protein n=1 Tax=Gemella haemolysans ATCC 10379 TaxID=546270 RepID=C5NUP9_9BACL|nr:hypothetical protein [Gemella haemolysans]EER69058.1 hypothetical protein GEMHA0001_1275 [Gemella haemolysans ATCC 10379]UBH82065.1 hypothetical protein LA340_06955 [Gemella haemolysans]VEI38018.1 Uncharacterised protein [Gemella haemolysans]